MNIGLAVNSVTTVLLASKAKKATMFLTNRLVVSVCRRHKYDARSRARDYVLKIGVPNYLERELIRRRKAPLNTVLLRPWPVPR